MPVFQNVAAKNIFFKSQYEEILYTYVICKLVNSINLILIWKIENNFKSKGNGSNIQDKSEKR